MDLGTAADAVAKAFVEHYYRTFDSNRAALVGLYQEGSMLTFEGQQFQGPAAIADMLESLPQCHVKVVTVDCQSSGPYGGVNVLVNGLVAPREQPIDISQLCIRSGKLFYKGCIRTGPEERPIKFSQVFHLLPVGGTFFVQSEMFRLNHG